MADGWWSQALTFYSGEEKLVLRINQHHSLDTTALQGWGYTGANGNSIFDSWEQFLSSIHNSKYPVSWQQLADKTWLNGPLSEQLLKKMESWFPYLPKEKHVLHGDYGFDNLLLSSTSEVTAVIDWAEMMLGDPLYDLVHMCEPWVRRTGLTYIDLWKKRNEDKGKSIQYFEERLQCYKIHYTLFHLHIHTVRKEEKEYREVEKWAMANL